MNDTPRITIYGTAWCGGSRRVRQLFDRNNIPYTWIDIEQDDQAARYVEGLNRGYRSVPTIVWPDGSRLVEPSDAEIARKLGIEL